MGKVDFVKAARKQWTCQKCGKPIEIGTSYYRGEVNFGPTFIRCTDCKLEAWEVTSSEYQRAIGRIQAKWLEEFPLTEEGIESIKSELESIQDEVQERFDNIPEGLQEGTSGQLLMDRIDGLTYAIDALDLIDIDDLKEYSVSDAFDTNEIEVEEYPDYDDVMSGDYDEDLKQEILEDFESKLTSEIEDALSELQC